MLSGNAKEVEIAMRFFQKHVNQDLAISLTYFEGLTESQRMRVIEASSQSAQRHRIRLINLQNQMEIEINLDHFSFATLSEDHKAIEIRRLLGGLVGFRLTAAVVD
jgi:hypothetical protein